MNERSSSGRTNGCHDGFRGSLDHQIEPQQPYPRMRTKMLDLPKGHRCTNCFKELKSSELTATAVIPGHPLITRRSRMFLDFIYRFVSGHATSKNHDFP